MRLHFVNSKECKKDHILEISEKHNGISKSKLKMGSQRQWNTKGNNICFDYWKLRCSHQYEKNHDTKTFQQISNYTALITIKYV